MDRVASFLLRARATPMEARDVQNAEENERDQALMRRLWLPFDQ